MSLLRALLGGRKEEAPAEPECVFEERREEERRAVFQEAYLVLDEYWKLRAVVTNVGATGARIAFATRTDLPFRLRLIAPTLRLKCWARVVWQDDGAAGLEFQEEWD